MVLLSFSVKEHELQTRTKTNTVRPYTPKRLKELWNATTYQVWWKSRTKDGYKLYDAIQDSKPYLVIFELEECAHSLGFCCYRATVRGDTFDYPSFTDLTKISREDFTLLAQREGFTCIGDMMLHFIHAYGSHFFGRPFVSIPFTGVPEGL
jgi:hypothetical protein